MTRALVWLGFGFVGCGAAPPAAESKPRVVQVPAPREEAETRVDARADANSCTPRPRAAKPLRPLAAVAPSPDDPLAGHFDLSNAVEGLKGNWPLQAEIETSAGTLECELWDEVAPTTVANFVGLARGTRPWKRNGTWVRAPAYEGSSFHRVIKGFMIQGGDPTGTGKGDPGYSIPNEIDEEIHPDRRGLLYVANRGPNTNGMQFFILDAAAPHLYGQYTAFGECGPSEVIARIAETESKPVYERVRIERVVVSFERPCR